MLNNKATFRGFTALHYAALVGNMKVAKLLIENGANPCLETEAGQKPVVYAEEGPLKEYLQQQTVRVSIKYFSGSNNWLFRFAKYEDIQKEKELEERRKFPLEDRLKKYIVGQEGAIATVAASRSFVL